MNILTIPGRIRSGEVRMSTWEDNHLAHYGIKGQKWGVRRFQNEDGSLTEAGKDRYHVEEGYKKTFSMDSPEKNYQLIDKHMTKKGKGKDLNAYEKAQYLDLAVNALQNDNGLQKILKKEENNLLKDLNSRYDYKKDRKAYEKAADRYIEAYNDIQWSAVEQLYEQILDIAAE